MNGGDTVALCKGGSWDRRGGNGARGREPGQPGIHHPEPSCSATSTCDFRDYDPSPVSPSPAKPIIRVADGVDAFGFGRSRFNTAGYTATPSGASASSTSTSWPRHRRGRRLFIYGKTEDLEICNNTIRDGFGGAYGATTTSTINRVNFHHNRVTNNPYGIGVVAGTSCAADCVFDSNYFDLNGGASNRDHTIYVGSSPDPVRPVPRPALRRQRLLHPRPAHPRHQQRDLPLRSRLRLLLPGRRHRRPRAPRRPRHREQPHLRGARHRHPPAATASSSPAAATPPAATTGPSSVATRSSTWAAPASQVSQCADCVVEDNLIVRRLHRLHGRRHPLPERVRQRRCRLHRQRPRHRPQQHHLGRSRQLQHAERRRRASTRPSPRAPATTPPTTSSAAPTPPSTSAPASPPSPTAPPPPAPPGSSTPPPTPPPPTSRPAPLSPSSAAPTPPPLVSVPPTSAPSRGPPRTTAWPLSRRAPRARSARSSRKGW